MMARFVPYSFKSEHLVKINHTLMCAFLDYITSNIEIYIPLKGGNGFPLNSLSALIILNTVSQKKLDIQMCKFLLKGSDFIILFRNLNFKYRGLTKYHD